DFYPFAVERRESLFSRITSGVMPASKQRTVACSSRRETSGRGREVVAKFRPEFHRQKARRVDAVLGNALRSKVPSLRCRCECRPSAWISGQGFAAGCGTFA